MLLEEYGRDMSAYFIVAAPFTHCYWVWGFEGMMVMVADRPELVKYVCERCLALMIEKVKVAAILGAEIIWIEDLYGDMISPDAFKDLCVPYTARLAEEIRKAGMKSIDYFTGNPAKKFDCLMSIGADAIAFEESLKGFKVDMDDIVDAVQGRCTVLGNLSVIKVLQDGTEDGLKAEISRQISAGRRNKGRFIMSLSTTPTPLTPVERVRLYCDMAHDIAAKKL
jgi:Uroporphyrinogen-III decarboxylase